MAIIGKSFIDLIDIYKQQDGRGQYIPIIEMLSQLTPILDDAIAVECNKGAEHLHAVRSGLPPVAWGQLYKGIVQSKSQKSQVTDTTGFVEAMSTIDSRVLDLSGNRGAIRLSEAQSILEAMAIEVDSRIFYANSSANPEQFMGLSPRFNVAPTNATPAQNSNQVIDAGGTGAASNTSIWFVTWGDNQTQLLYPRGTKAGVAREDMGRQRVLDAAGNPYYAEEEKFTWHVGLAVKDWRYIARICNIDFAGLKNNTVKLYDFMRKAYYKLQNRRVAGGKIAIYCNRDVMESLDALATNAGVADNFVRLARKEVDGAEVLSYRGIPIRETDALINTEARVV